MRLPLNMKYYELLSIYQYLKILSIILKEGLIGRSASIKYSFGRTMTKTTRPFFSLAQLVILLHGSIGF